MSDNPLPSILAGPIVRQALTENICFWLISKAPFQFSAKLFDANSTACWFNKILTPAEVTQVRVGEFAYVNLITIEPSEQIPCGSEVSYDLSIVQDNQQQLSIGDSCAGLLYPNQAFPSFILEKNVTKILHGSCRKPHHDSVDGLSLVDEQISQAIAGQDERPDLLLMSGDQVYVDDVSGPMLVAIQQTIQQLGLFAEALPGSLVSNSRDIFEHIDCYYQRPALLPDLPSTEAASKAFFAGKKKPIFTSDNANNHLISFAEVMAMYILVWSPEMWQRINLTDEAIPEKFKAQFSKEKQIVERFAAGLSDVRRALAHIPVYMIFDDHDVTDDWNLTRGWEEAVYQNEFAKRIVGNALLGYWLCQGWGNAPHKLNALYSQCKEHFCDAGIVEHDVLIDKLLAWDRWQYSLDTQPKIVVLDTRTQRWRSESSLSKPSGLMDWEALCELQQELIGQKGVIMVSAAPVFGVKLIEAIQRIFTFLGKALTVDAENWMAHKGTASVMLNIFRNRKTPPNFVILSGDVHYSFVYDISLRFRQNSPHITQVTSSGIKNEFPPQLLAWFDRLNRILYHKRSPLNWFTKRRNMRVQPRKPDGYTHRTLLNQAGIGLLKIDKNCEKVEATQLCASGEEVRFLKKNDERQSSSK